MEVILIIVVTSAGYLIAYNLYGRFLAKKIFKLNNENLVPSVEFKDEIDFVPTRKGILFGHHYTSIAGTGPIVGPAIGIIWGWVPALLWVFLGSIIMGAVHDFGSLVISMRNQGKSLSDITSKYISRRVRYIFFLIIFFELLIVIAIFGLVIAIIFAKFPQSVFPVWMEIPIAVTLGYLIYKKNGNINILTLMAVVLMYITVVSGHYLPFKMPPVAGIPATGVWTVILLIYASIASILPVTLLLQPRDYINAWELFVAMALLAAGILASGFVLNLKIVAPAFNIHPEGAPPIWPFLFITIACGAISGFHCLVSSGTSSKQLSCENDALFVGYGSMLLESLLAVLIIIAVAAGIGIAYKSSSGELLTGIAAWQCHYKTWTASQGLGSKIGAVVIGSANMMTTLGVPKTLGIIVIGVFIASFAGTTLDTATRIQRYIISEAGSALKIKLFKNKIAATLIAVITAALLAFSSGADGSGALKLWPMFGAVNQLLAALALLFITVYLRQKNSLYLISGIPCVFMILLTVWCVIINEINFVSGGLWILSVINGIITFLAVWMVIESIIIFFTKRENHIRSLDDNQVQPYYIYLNKNNTQYGPLSSDRIKELITSGYIISTDYIWDSNINDWIIFSDNNEFSKFFPGITDTDDSSEEIPDSLKLKGTRIFHRKFQTYSNDRLYKRLQVQMPAEIKKKNANFYYNVKIENISIGGLAIISFGDEYRLNDEVDLRLFLDSHNRYIQIDGKVVRLKNIGPKQYETGIEFVNFSKEDGAQLINILLNNLDS